MNAAHPSITTAQNSERALTLLAAQRRLYSDAKTIQGTRFLIAATGALGSIAAALAFPPWRTLIGIITGLVLLSVSVLGGAREKRKTKEASSVQEELDVMLFGLDWNDMCADRPTTTTITTAATRHNCDHSDLRDWYPDTDTVPYPMNVLICQNSNLGWGSTAHRRDRGRRERHAPGGLEQDAPGKSVAEVLQIPRRGPGHRRFAVASDARVPRARVRPDVTR